MPNEAGGALTWGARLGGRSLFLFEDQPLLLVPLILVTVVCYDLVKHVLLRVVRQHSRRNRVD